MSAETRLPFSTVRTEGLTKLYGRTPALVSVTVELRAGAVTVIEGHNGSGKSTMVQLLAQLARPTRGTIAYGELSGADARRHVGLLAHAPMLYPDLTGLENLTLFASLYGVSGELAPLRDRFELGTFAERPTRTCSRGQLQRLALARALLAEPALLLLDEPSTGLDVRGVERLESVIDEERKRGAIVVLVTHDAAFAQRLADRTIRLSRGRVIEEVVA
ncbi:MAG: ATP-binding cassette domain-containing protein [Deltaproteobacteria bacterium]|nr:ATP-binding cassette domain-containing protein [Deltaproteobacteria bacterium]